MTAHTPIDTAPLFQRARGLLSIGVQRAHGDTTRLKTLRQEGSFRAIFPRPTAGKIEAVLINTAGGITGGDQFKTSVVAHENAQISVTTQAAERIYRAPDVTAGSMQTTLSAHAGAQLFWLPQETILFDGSRLKRRLDVDIHERATFLMVEPLVFGREASNETLRSGALDDGITITSGGRRIYSDRIKLEGNIAATLQRPAVANGARAVANIILVDRAASTMLDPVRAALPPTAGASLLADNILVIRLLASDSFALRSAIFPILTLLTSNTVPKNWRL